MIPLYNLIGLVIFISIFIILACFSCWDIYRNRVVKIKEREKITFVIPCYNDGDTIEETIRYIKEAYDNSEIIVVNDCSKDNSKQILEELSKKENFIFLDNKINCGKASSINSALKLVKTDIFFVIDADTQIYKNAIEDALARFQCNDKIGAVSCRYATNNDGFLPFMQEIEYSMLGIVQGSYNVLTSPSLWGGCMGFRKKVFEEVGGLSTNAIIEDMDMALKTIKAGYKVEQSWHHVDTDVPYTIRGWWKQKLRWTSGTMQCFIKYPSIWLKQPLYLIFLCLYSILMITSIYGLVHGYHNYENIYNNYDNITSGNLSSGIKFINENYTKDVSRWFFIKTSFSLFSLPYVILSMRTRKWKWYYVFLIIPYSFIYLPMLFVVSIAGFVIGLIRFPALKKGERAW